MRHYILVLLLLLSRLCVSQVVLRGHVTDGYSGEVLPDAVVFVKELNRYGTAGLDGSYSLEVSPGVYTLIASYIGYHRKELLVDAAKSVVIDFPLDMSTRIAEVEVLARSRDANVTATQMGYERLSAAGMRRMPALMGEVDPLKAIQLLPGVQTVSEGGSGFSVRGGAPDQNLILIDNTTIYNASHLLGFFSIFNNDVLSDVSIYKGDIPIRHGGRLSSLLDVQTKTNHPKSIKANGGIGLISSRLSLEGPLGDRTSWLIGGRRSYADLFLKLASEAALRRSTIYFYDLNGKLTHRPTERDRIELTGYLGNDKFGSDVGAFRYGNTAISLLWGHVASEHLIAKTSVHYAGYNYSLASDLEEMRASWVSSINDYTIRFDLNHPLSPLWNISYGISSTYHNFHPGVITIDGYDGLRKPPARSWEHAIYGNNEQELTEHISLKYGLRWSLFQNMGSATVPVYNSEYKTVDSLFYASGRIYNTYASLEPRVGAVIKLPGSSSSVKSYYARNVQFIQLANNASAGSPLDVWFSAGPNVKPQYVDMFSAGYFRNFSRDAYETSVEFYYKKLTNVIDFADHARLLLSEDMESEIRVGSGRAYGMELMLRRNVGSLTGFINYTLSRTERTIPEINGGKTYLAPYDKTHVLNLVLNYEFSPRWNISGVWIYSTGNPATYPAGRFEIGSEVFPIYSGRNEYRRPDYHRLDVSINYIPRVRRGRRWKGEWNLSFFNLYGKKNPWIITYTQDLESGIPSAEMLYLFGIVPSVTYNFKF